MLLDRNKVYYFGLLSYLAIAYSAIHFFTGYALAKIIFALFLLITTNLKFITKPTFLYLIISFGIIVLGQFATLGGFDFVNMSAVLVVTVIIPYAICDIEKLSFPKFYTKAMLLICIISLPFYIGSIMSPSFFHSLQEIAQKYSFLDPSEYDRQFILHSAASAKDSFSGLIRNAGPFNEAGVHALFLIIGIYFNFITTKKIFNFAGMTFIVSLLFTFSTAGYIGFFALFIGINTQIKINKTIKILTTFALIVFVLFFFFSNELMYSKVKNQYVTANQKDLNERTGGRFYGARKAFNVLQHYPVFGRGLTHATREKDEYSTEFLRYGILSEFGKIGIPFAILYLIMLYKGIRSYEYRYGSKIFLSISFYIALLINLFSQSFALYPVLMIIVITGIKSYSIVLCHEKKSLYQKTYYTRKILS